MRAIAAIAAVSAIVVAVPAAAQDKRSIFGRAPASVTYGPYLRFEAGTAKTEFADANWLPPGASDPRVFFNLGDDAGGLVSAAVGFDWMNGFRGDVGLVFPSDVNATGTWSRTVPPVPGPHADITRAPVETTAVIANLFYSPLEQRGVNSRIQPYVVAGLGIARNELGDWTRSNAASGQPVRTFAGDSDPDLAFSLGLGVSWQITRPGRHPVLLDVSYKYYDFGSVSGSTVPLGPGASSPREALNFDRRDSVVSLGLRVPLRRH